jgi:hypothetical protein
MRRFFDTLRSVATVRAGPSVRREAAVDPPTRLHARCPAAAGTSPAACVGPRCVACAARSFEHLHVAAAGSMAADLKPSSPPGGTVSGCPSARRLRSSSARPRAVASHRDTCPAAESSQLVCDEPPSVPQRLGAASSLDAAPMKCCPTAAGVRLFHGGGREARATYRTAAAVGKLPSSVLRLLA